MKWAWRKAVLLVVLAGAVAVHLARSLPIVLVPSVNGLVRINWSPGLIAIGKPCFFGAVGATST
jgi:hypothetical protein